MTLRPAILAASLAALVCAVYAACNPVVEPTECASYVEETCNVAPPSASGVKAEADCGRFSFELQGVQPGSETILRTRRWTGTGNCYPDEPLASTSNTLDAVVTWTITAGEESRSGSGTKAEMPRPTGVCTATCTFALSVSPSKCSPPAPVEMTGTAVFENAVSINGGGPRVCTTSESHSAHRFPYTVACAANKKAEVTENAEIASDDGAAVVVRGKAAGDAAVTVSADCGSDEKSFDVVELDRLTLRGCGCIDGDDPAFETMEGKGEVTATLTTTPAQYSNETYVTVVMSNRTAKGWFDCERDGVEATDEPRTNRTYEVVRLGGLQVIDTNGESRVDADLMRLRPGLCYEVRNTNAYTKAGQNVLSVADFAVLETNVVSVCPTVETSSDGWTLFIPTNEVKASFALVLSNTCHTCDFRRVECKVEPLPKVHLSLKVPEGLVLDGERRKLTATFSSDVETNGWMLVRCVSGEDKIEFWSGQTNGTALTCSNSFAVVKDFTFSCYVQGVARSAYEGVEFECTYAPASGSNKVVRAKTTVFECYIQPVSNKTRTGLEVINPSFLSPQSNAVFRVEVKPTEIPASKINWRTAAGTAAFQSGTNGLETVVLGGSGFVDLEVRVLGATDERMHYKANVIQ